MNPLGQEHGADQIRVARSRYTTAGGGQVWLLYVSDQLVEECGDEWSQPVQFKFERLSDGRLDMLLRTVSEDQP